MKTEEPPVVEAGADGEFYRDMSLVGAMRCATVVLGLVAVKYVAVATPPVAMCMMDSIARYTHIMAPSLPSMYS